MQDEYEVINEVIRALSDPVIQLDKWSQLSQSKEAFWH